MMGKGWHSPWDGEYGEIEDARLRAQITFDNTTLQIIEPGLVLTRERQCETNRFIIGQGREVTTYYMVPPLGRTVSPAELAADEYDTIQEVMDAGVTADYHVE